MDGAEAPKNPTQVNRAARQQGSKQPAFGVEGERRKVCALAVAFVYSEFVQSVTGEGTREFVERVTQQPALVV